MPTHEPNGAPRLLAVLQSSRNPLTFLPAKYRLAAYAVLGLLSLALTAYQAADGDWLKAVTFFLGSLGFGTAASHVDLQQPPD